MRQVPVRCAVISPDGALISGLSEILSESSSVDLVKTVTAFPDECGLRRLLLFNAPEVIFLDARRVQQALEVVSLLDKTGSDAHVVAICNDDSHSLGSLMRAGVREYIDTSADARAVEEAISRSVAIISRKPTIDSKTGQIVSFLPVKAGVGASTIAINTSLALSRLPDVRTLLADFDVGAGIVGFVFKLHHGYSIKDALANARDMDETLWSRLAARVNELDILPSECEIEHNFDFEKIGRLLDYLRRAYTVTCIDLPGSLDPASIELMRESNKIYLVCTQELPCLHILRKKAQVLRSMGLEERVRIIVNRYRGQDIMNVDRIKDVTDFKLEMTLPNDYKQSTVSAGIGTNIDPKGELWAKFQELAHTIMSLEAPKRPVPRRFVDYFSILPGTKALQKRAQAVGG
jgi:pilus assembly protein CpaE